MDIDDCSSIVSESDYRSIWHFIQHDDVAFADEFTSWAGEKGLPETIDLLFIDTSHEYEHTVQEINAWFPLLSESGRVIFHDTNMGQYFKRKNGSIVIGWDNNRGVIRAIEEKLGRSYNEREPFIDMCGGWLVEHEAYSNGLTIMTRIR